MRYRLCVRDVLSTLTGGLIAPSKDRVKYRAIKTLSSTFVEVRTCPDANMDPKVLLDLDVSVSVGALTVNTPNEKNSSSLDGGLMPDANGDFFIPRTREFLKDHDLDPESSACEKSARKPSLRRAVSDFQHWNQDALEKLANITTFKNSDLPMIFGKEFNGHLHAVGDPEWTPSFYYDMKWKSPHVKLVVYNTAEGDTSQLMQTELRLLIAAVSKKLQKWDEWEEQVAKSNQQKKLLEIKKMTEEKERKKKKDKDKKNTEKTQENEKVKNKGDAEEKEESKQTMVKLKRVKGETYFDVIPILLVSFIGVAQARVIIANFNCRKKTMSVRMSELLPVRPHDAESWTFLRRFMASDITETK
ncbi:hypothetical protein BJY04DRAFT_213970 [Aspergillus karnatakaensis]|uniref:uncharacterized protein n=1 Tax=Aspergillus karnatakaensis TaxID=1810916 RepID=UPI003CCE302D